MVSWAVELAIRRMSEMDYESQLEYLHTLPKGMPARVVGEILCRARSREYTERLTREEIETIARNDKILKAAGNRVFWS